VTAAFPDHAGRLPGAIADTHVDAGDRRCAGPCDTADDEVADGDILVPRRLGD
jgi:hypothetical protein